MLWPDFSDKNSWRDRFSRDVMTRDLRKSLRSLFLKDWTLKALALGITLVLWYGVTGQRAPVTERLTGVPLVFRPAAGLVISNEPRTDVELTVLGGRQVLDRLRGRDLETVVDLSSYGPGEHTIVLNNADRVSDSIKVTGLPEGVERVRIEPNAVKIRLETSTERSVKVDVQKNGNLPEGREIYDIRVQPETVRVTGPASRIQEVQQVQSEPITLNGHYDTFEVSKLRLLLPDEKVDLVDAYVKVLILIGEQRIERKFDKVTVNLADGIKEGPAKASLTLFGPRSIIEQLHPEDLEIVVQSKDGVILPPTFNVVTHPDWNNSLKLNAIEPDLKLAPK